MIALDILIFILIIIAATVVIKRNTKTFIAPNDQLEDQFVDGSGWWAS